MPKICLKRIKIGKEFFDGEIFLLPDGRFIFIFPDWMEDLAADLQEHGFNWQYNPKRGTYRQAGVAMAETQRELEDKIEAIVNAANKMAAEETLVIFYKFGFCIRSTSENETLRDSEFAGSRHFQGTETGLDLDWQIVRQFKYSENNVIYKRHKSENQVQAPHHGDKTRIVDHTFELQEFFENFDSALEAMIEKLLAINNAEALPELIEKMGPLQLMAPEAVEVPGHYRRPGEDSV